MVDEKKNHVLGIGVIATVVGLILIVAIVQLASDVDDKYEKITSIYKEVRMLSASKYVARDKNGKVHYVEMNNNFNTKITKDIIIFE